ncbi:MAG: hypothetical protein U0269_16535 [Polyangiales bacterium]
MNIEQLEALAFGEDRAAAREALVAGSVEHSYWTAIHLQHEDKLAEVDALIARWPHKDGQGEALRERLERRQLLLRAGVDLDSVVKELRRQSGVRLDAQRERTVEANSYPSIIEAEVDLAEECDRLITERRNDLSAFASWADDWLVERWDKLSAAQRQQLVARLAYSAQPALAKLVARELEVNRSSSFGSASVHHTLTLDQLLALRTIPKVEQSDAWVQAVLARFQPSPHDSTHSDEVLDRWITEALDFCRTLLPAFNRYRAQALIARLSFDFDRGRANKSALVELLELPIVSSYANSTRADSSAQNTLIHPADLLRSAGLPPRTRDPSELIAALCEHFVRVGESSDIEPLLDRSWFASVQAKTLLCAGATDAEPFVQRFGPEWIARLRDEVRLQITWQNALTLRSDADVSIELALKNVPALTIKVFELDRAAYFHHTQSAVQPEVDLDGMVAQHERTLRFEHAPILEHRERIALDECKKPGAYIVEFIGNGRSARAFIVKGRMSCHTRNTVAGAVLYAFDEDGAPLADATVAMGGRTYTAREDGGVTLPFSERASSVTALVTAGGRYAQLESISLPAERFDLQLSARIERESLVAQKRAKILLRPVLTVADVLAPLALIEEPTVQIDAVRHDGVSSSKTERLALEELRESTVELRVAEELASVTVTLRGSVRLASSGQLVPLSATVSLAINAIHTSSETNDLYLSRSSAGYAIECLGKSGEPIPNLVLTLYLRHRALNESKIITAQCDEHGRVALGPLRGYDSICAVLPSQQQRLWSITDEPALASNVHVVEGESIALPCSEYTALHPAGVALVRLAGASARSDHTHSCKFADQSLVIDSLEPGAYLLRTRASGPTTSIIVAPRQARVTANVALTERSLIELRAPTPFVSAAQIQADSVVLSVRNATSATRVHLVATRFVATPTHRSGAPSLRAPERRALARQWIAYLSNRQLSDEYRYVIERKRAPRRAGVMLDKPSLLANPWARESVETNLEQLGLGAGYQGTTAGFAASGAPMPKPAAPEPRQHGGDEDPAHRTYDFVREPAAILENLPVIDGAVRVPLAALGAGRVLRAITVDAASAHEFEFALDERPAAPRDLRLTHALAADAHAIELRAVEAAPSGSTLTVDDVRTSRLELLDTVASVWRTLSAINAEATPADWSFVTQWSTLDLAKKRALYNDFACHELHLFLLHKDRAFFDETVRPHLANKRNKTFVDRALLGENLSRYLDPWQLSKLNAIERALLARALPAAKQALVRWFSDSVELTPPDPERERRLLDTILGSSGLEGGGFADAADKLSSLMQEAAAAPPSPMEISADMPSMQPEIADDEPSPEEDSDEAEEESTRREMKPRAKKKMAKEDSFGDEGGRGGGGGRGAMLDMRDRAARTQLFRAPERTREWAESNWWRTREEHARADKVAPNRYWLDWAQHDGAGPFLSRWFAECATSFTDALCALAVMDVPFVAGAHTTALDDVRYSVALASDALAASTKIVAKEPSVDPGDPILIGQRYLRDDDRDEYEGNVRRDKYVSGPMLVGVAYVCRVVVSNPTSSERELDLLLQIPRGAMPVSNGFLTKSTRLWLGAYATQSIEYAFYFPREGRYSHFGAHVSQRDALVAFAEGASLEVLRSLDQTDTSSWTYLSQHAPLPELLEHLSRCNLQRVEFARLAWRLRQKDSYEAIVRLLEARLHFDSELWAYSLLHKDRPRIAAWLAHQEELLSPARPALDRAIIALDPVERGWHEHLEYAPLINARAHRVGARTQILNAALGTQYQRTLELIAHRPSASDDDLLAVAHYLFAQERFDEARSALARVRPENVASRVAFDYLRAFAACAEGSLERARELALPWRDYPVDRWRKRFTELLSAIDEAEASAPAPKAQQATDSRDQRVEASASKEPSLDLAVESGRVIIQHRNVSECELRLYRMDIELLFSRQPFVQGETQRFSWISPGHSQTISLSDAGRTSVELPAAFAKDNLVIELRAKGARKQLAYYAHDLAIELTAAFGQLRVLRASTQRPLPATYVKVFARHNDGSVRFFKDGYTDLRGRFDYASVSTNELDSAQRFSILVCSDEAGATVLEAGVPQR